MLKLVDLMQQHDSDALIQEQQRRNKLKREEMVLRYKSASPPYYQEGKENEKFNKEFKILNLQFIMLLSKKSQLKVYESLEKLSRYL